MKSVLSAPKYLLPLKEFIDNWPVIACDQHSSDLKYWEKLELDLGTSISTMKIIIPEAYYSRVIDWSKELKALESTTINYVRQKYLSLYDEGIILVKRTTDSGNRLGVLLLLDLEEYDFTERSNASVKATEHTNRERLIQRKLIRSSVSIELSHTIVFFDDINDRLFRNYRKIERFQNPIYDIELNNGGGHLSAIPIKEKDKVIDYFSELLSNKDNSFYVGDGNHSLAAAKEYWNEIKTSLNLDEQNNHPLRYYLVEMINIHDNAVTFYPIHRIIYPVTDEFLEKFLNLNIGKNKISIYFQGQKHKIFLDDDTVSNYNFIDDLLIKESLKADAKIDFIHGEEEVIQLSDNFPRCLGVIMPAINKNQFFDLLEKHDILPNKSFSVGKSNEKRYYFEGRKLEY